MNKRELSLMLLVLIGLILTGFTLVDRSTYDCTQPLFSNQSSCSIVKGSCVKIHSSAGFVGLWSSLKSFVVEDEKKSFTLKCLPGCSIKIETSTNHSHNLDSSDYPNNNVVRK